MISNNKHYLSGRKKFEAKNFDGALNDYSKSIEEEENPNVYSERAVVYYYLKKLDLSLADMNHAADLEPQNPYRYSSRAYIRDAMGDLEGAIEDYEKAVKLDPEDAIAHNNLGLLQEKLGYKEKAQSNYKRADKLADVDELLSKIRAEQRKMSGGSSETDPEALAESAAQIQQDREDMSVLALLRYMFTTKSGFKEYLTFVKRGLKF